MAKSIVTIILFVLGWVNAYLVKNGHTPLPEVNGDQISMFIAFVISLIAMIRENPFKKLKKAAKKDK